MILLSLTLLAPFAAIPAPERAPSPPPGVTLRGEALPLPPPPSGMKRLSAEEQAELAARAEQAAPEESEEIDEASADLEALRAMEAFALQSGPSHNAVLLESAEGLGPGHPLRMRLEDVLSEVDQREEAAFELQPVTNVATFDVSLIEDRYDIPVEMQPLVAEYIRFFQGNGRRWYRKWMARSTRYIPMMQPILEKAGVPRDLVYLAMIESGFSAQAYSWAKAAGPWQFIPGTGTEFGLKQDFWVDERRDPIKSTWAAAAFLKQLHRQLGHWYLAWAGYNTGGSRVRRLCNRMDTRDFWQISAGRGLAQETKHYVPKLIAAAIVSKNLEAFGFSHDEFDYQAPLEFDVVTLSDPTDLAVIAKAAGVQEEDLKELNPELKRWCTPPASEEKPYLLRLPKGTSERFADRFAKIPKKQRLRYVEHRVKRGDTLSVIARRYRTDADPIMKLNGLKSARGLKIRSTLMIPVPTSRAGRAAAAKAAEVDAKERSSTKPAPPMRAAVKGKTRISYGVQNGDTLWGICQKFQCSVDQLRTWNQLPRKGRRLKVGTVLAIWTDRVAQSTAPARASASGSASRTHRIANGDTLWSVSRQYGVSVDELKQWNGISDHRAVRSGQKLRVASP